MNAIVAADANWAIGRDNELLFSLPTDMKRFRSLTTGGTVIMGRKTLDSFPGGKPLPNRRNIVITRDPDFNRDDCLVAPCPQDAVALAAGTPQDQLWVVGGGSVYTALLQQCRRVYLTKVYCVAQDADTFFPNLDKLPGWKLESISDPVEENGYTYRFLDYVNHNMD